MPIYIVNDDTNNTPSFKKIENLWLSLGAPPGTSGGSGKKICKVYICTNTDPLQFKLVYNGCRECDCLCDWCLLEGSVNDYYCSYHAEERKQSIGSGQANCGCDFSNNACLYEDCVDEEGNPNPNWVFTPGCYYSYTVDCTVEGLGELPGGPGGPGGPSVGICYKACCNSQLSSCSVFGTLQDNDNCCAYKNSSEYESGKMVLNPNLYCNCYDEIPPDDLNGWSCP